MGQERQCVQGKWPAVPGPPRYENEGTNTNSSFDRAEEYLRRVAQLTGAKQMIGCCLTTQGRAETLRGTANSCVSSHTIANRLAFLGTDQMSRMVKKLVPVTALSNNSLLGVRR